MSTVAKKIMMGSGAVAEPFEIEQSLIFEDGSSAYLTRTPSSASNRKTWTWSSWVKRGNFASSSVMGFFSACDGSAGNTTWIGFSSDSLAAIAEDGDTSLVTTAGFRDLSAWYHIVFVYDSTQGTAANRQKIYVNGVQETSFSTANYPDQNLDSFINNDVQHTIGSRVRPSGSPVTFFDGYLAETHFIDGTALTPSSFGETNSATGQWIPKEYTGGSYGTNGFYLKFVSGAIGTDSSGNSNTYSATNLANSDVVTDSPTNNFATWNSLIKGSNTYSEGNLIGTNSTSAGAFMASTIGVSSGKYYCEIIIPSLNNWNVGIANSSADRSFIGVDAGSGGWLLYASSTTQYVASSATSISQGWEVGNYVGLGIDADNKVFYLYKNGTQVISYDYSGFAGDEAFFGAGNYSAVANTIVNFGQNPTHCGGVTAGTATDGNGIGLFKYAPPSGFLALCTANLPDPAIALPSAHFNTVLYAGNGSTQSISGVGHQPDLVWIKNRAAADNHKLTDAVRGATKELESNTTDAEATNADGLTAFASDGFALGDDDEYNTNNEAYVSWNWKANGSGSTDTSGDIDAVVSANQAAGFSIVTWTANGSAAGTIPHGLGVVPEAMFYKARSTVSGNWAVWVTVIDGSNDYLLLNTTAAKSDNDASWGSPSSSMISNFNFANNTTTVAYCFASKPGFSSIGSYTGNGSATAGPFVNCGFKPAWVLYKRTDALNDWLLFDNKRDVDNVASHRLFPNKNFAEYTNTSPIDILSNGFKLRVSSNDTNANNGVYLYMAFAESPFKTANAR